MASKSPRVTKFSSVEHIRFKSRRQYKPEIPVRFFKSGDHRLRRHLLNAVLVVFLAGNWPVFDLDALAAILT